jgi:hypothetical protein
MPMLRSANLALAFFLELAALVALGYWGFQTGRDLPTALVLGLGAPLAMAVVWGLFLAPRAARRLRGPWLVGVHLVIFGLAAAGLAAAGQPAWAGALIGAVLINEVLLTVWRQREQ